jgi:flagellar protein FlbD
VILLTRLGGPVFALNPDLVERCDCTPDTVITLVDGKKYLVAESLPEVISLIRQYRATVIADAQHITGETPVNAPHSRSTAPRATDGGHASHDPDIDAEPTNVVQLHPRER